jgi:hypothetical protein
VSAGVTQVLAATIEVALPSNNLGPTPSLRLDSRVWWEFGLHVLRTSQHLCPADRLADELTQPQVILALY